MPDGAIRLGSRCIGVREEGAHVVAELADGTEVRGGALIGADGIHSIVRENLAEAPRYTGNACWRGMTPAAVLPPGLIERDMTVWFGPVPAWSTTTCVAAPQ